MFINDQVYCYGELDVHFQNAEEAATDSPIYDDCSITDLVSMYIAA